MEYTISDEKLNRIVEIVREGDSEVSKQEVKDAICYDWDEGVGHQEWIDSADPQEIADWLATFAE